MPRLTKSIVDAARPREKQFTIWCGDTKGFGVYVHPTGKRTYFVDYYNAGGARKRMAIGQHGNMTCEQARKIAMKTIGDVTIKSEDPLAERKSRRNSITVKELCADYMAAAEAGLIFGKGGRAKKPVTIYQDHARINRHIVPLLGKKLVKDITRADVAAFIRDVTLGKTAIVEKTGLRGKAVVTGGAGTAARAANFLGAILSWAVHEEIIEHNPAHGVKRQADKKRTRRLTPDEYRALGRALAQAEEERDTWQGLAGTRLLALTGCRLGEIVKLHWSEVDAEGSALRLEDSKEGASTRPIGGAALDVLAALERGEGCPYVLPAARGSGPYGGLPSAFERLVARAGLEGVTPHTLRHSFASVAADLGFVESTIAAMLGHASGSVTSRYVHHLDAVLIAAADKVAGVIENHLTGAGS
ncbi:MAG: tyrosine-type recombinase/integrase [Methylocystis sp.]